MLIAIIISLLAVIVGQYIEWLELTSNRNELAYRLSQLEGELDQLEDNNRILSNKFEMQDF